MLDICLLGTGGMMPLPYRWLTSLMLRCEGSNVLIDCGEGTQIAIKEKGWSPRPIDVICFTHYHADHISGLPGLLLTLGNAERVEPVTMIGPKGLERVVNALRTIAPELPFSIVYKEIEDEIESFSIGPYIIDAFKVSHNITCYGYSIRIPRAGRFDAEAAKKLEIPLGFWSRLQRGETIEADGRTFTPSMVMGKERKGLKVTYCTDSRPVPIISDMANGSDLFICEGMYGEEGKEAKAREYKHMTMYEAARLGKVAGPRRMWLTHYSPSLNFPDDYMGDVKKIFPRCKAAKDGWTLELDFEEE